MEAVLFFLGIIGIMAWHANKEVERKREDKARADAKAACDLKAERDALEAENVTLKALKDEYGAALLEDCEGHTCPTKAELAAAQKRIAELEEVEWVEGQCPWCYRLKEEGHAPDCVRKPK